MALAKSLEAGLCGSDQRWSKRSQRERRFGHLFHGRSQTSTGNSSRSICHLPCRGRVFASSASIFPAGLLLKRSLVLGAPPTSILSCALIMWHEFLMLPRALTAAVYFRFNLFKQLFGGLGEEKQQRQHLPPRAQPWFLSECDSVSASQIWFLPRYMHRWQTFATVTSLPVNNPSWLNLPFIHGFGQTH